jgi:hypothetical protein
LAASLASEHDREVVAANSAPALMKTARKSQRSGKRPGAFGWVASPTMAPKKPPPKPSPPAMAAWRQTSTLTSESGHRHPEPPHGVGLDEGHERGDHQGRGQGRLEVGLVRAGPARQDRPSAAPTKKAA